MNTFLIIYSISVTLTLIVCVLQLSRCKKFTAYDTLEFDSFVEWVVNDAGELGIKIANRCAFLYKGYFLEYGNDAEITKYREPYKREFGECCISPFYQQKIHQEDDPKNPWKPIPAKPNITKRFKKWTHKTV